MAEAGGFEPPVACATLVFKTSAFGRSATPPLATTLSAGFSGCKAVAPTAQRGPWCRGALAVQAEMEGLEQCEVRTQIASGAGVGDSLFGDELDPGQEAGTGRTCSPSGLGGGRAGDGAGSRLGQPALAGAWASSNKPRL
jgi:hypothetical protein